METIHVTFDELTTMASEQFGLGLGLNPIPQKPCNTPNRDDWNHLIQPMFNEYFNPSPSAILLVLMAAAPRAVDIVDSPVSTSIDQDAPSIKSPKTPQFHDDPLHESLHEDLTSQGSSSNVRPSHTPLKLIGRWTKDHPIENMVGDPSRSVSMRKQLKIDAMWCYFDAFLTSVEPKNFKQAMTEPSWIDAMQEEIHEFERLQNWEPLYEDILGATAQRDTESNYPKRYWELLPKRYWELLPKEILGAITQRDTGSYYPKRD
ncbi:hypothetical protein Tco_0866945 [Tanacetum coccineum]